MLPTVLGRFTVERRAGAGGMGVVYRAKDDATGAPVALKVLGTTSEAVDEERFLREAKLLAAIDHPAVVRYVGHGRTDQGALYLAMEWLEGEELGERLVRGPLAPEEAIALARRIAAALTALHDRGIVHRDVKPSNVFLPGRSLAAAKLLDLGIARRATPETRVTTTGLTVGTPGYMAPEQARGEELDARADVFSLGCVLYECLAGRPAFPGEHVVAILARLLLEDPSPPSAFVAGLPAVVDMIVLRLLAKDRKIRPIDAAAASALLEGVAVEGLAAAPASNALASLRMVSSAERRVVSVVLARLPSRTLSHEDDRMLDELARSRGGEPVLGDGSLLVGFAGDGAATDRAARAAQFALRLRDALADVPISIATGRVLVAPGTGGRPLGEAVDQVARGLSGDARITVDEVTAQLLDTRFEVRESAAGRELVGERPLGIAPRMLLGRPTPCVGRERELGTLRALWEESARDSVARAALVLGEAGVGKSRLLHELLRDVDDRAKDPHPRSVDGAKNPPTVWLSRGEAVGKNSPFGLISGALRRAAGLFEGEPPLLKQAKLAAYVAERVGPDARDRVTRALAEIVGAPFDVGAEAIPGSAETPEAGSPRSDPVAIGDRIRASVEELVAAETAKRPLVFVVEDLHAGDQASVTALDTLLRRLKTRPLLVLAFARPEVLTTFPRLWASRGAMELWLAPLSPKASERLVRSALPAATGDDVARIVERADGNPFYVEELIRAASERAPVVPGTVLAMIEARLDALGAEARRALRAASVFGDRFWRGGVLKSLGGEARAADLDLAMLRLTEHEIIEAQPDARFPNEREFAFSHGLVRDVAYGMLTDTDRQLAHRHAARWLESVGETCAVTMAEHFERAGEDGRAAAWNVRAAEQALEGNDFDEVLARVERAKKLGASGDVLAHAHLLTAEACLWNGAHALGAASGRAAMALSSPDTLLFWSAARATAIHEGRCGRYDDLPALAAELESKPTPEALVGLRAVALGRCASALMHVGRVDEANAILALLPHAAACADPGIRAQMLTVEALRAQANGDPSGLVIHEEASRLLRLSGDRRAACESAVAAADAFSRLGLFERAEPLMREVMAEADAMGLTSTYRVCQTNLAYALAHLGRPEEGLPLLTDALEMFTATTNPRAEAWTRIYLSDAERRLGHFDEAARQAELAAACVPNAAPLLANALAELAAARRAQGDLAGALEAARRSMEHLEGIEEGETMVRLVAIEVHLAAGARDEALALLRSAALRVRESADKIADPALRAAFLEHHDARRTLDLERERERELLR